MLQLQSAPTTNGLGVTIHLMKTGVLQATLNAGATSVLTTSFDQVMLVNPPLAPVVRNFQNGTAAHSNPGDVATIRSGTVANTVVVSWARPGTNAQTATFQ
jgi:hypothetical protein